MKALSTRQPFAALIASGQKRLETRTWSTDYRGPLLICTGTQGHSLFDFYDMKSQILGLQNNSAKDRYFLDKALICAYGCALCVVDLVGIQTFKCGKAMEDDACCDWYPGAFAWELENVRLVEPVKISVVEPVKISGKLRLFEVDDSLIKFL